MTEIQQKYYFYNVLYINNIIHYIPACASCGSHNKPPRILMLAETIRLWLHALVFHGYAVDRAAHCYEECTHFLPSETDIGWTGRRGNPVDTLTVRTVNSNEFVLRSNVNIAFLIY